MRFDEDAVEVFGCLAGLFFSFFFLLLLLLLLLLCVGGCGVGYSRSRSRGRSSGGGWLNEIGGCRRFRWEGGKTELWM